MLASDLNVHTLPQTLRIAGMWILLFPLIVILGIIDLLTEGRSRSWPLGEKPYNQPD
jgi:hypothetical protein